MILVAQFQGRFGNQALEWLFARAYAAKHGFEFQCDPWVGEQVFEHFNIRPHGVDGWPRYNEKQLAEKVPDHSFVFRGYAQMQSCMIYTKREAQAWLKLKPDIEAACMVSYFPIVAHRRVGDYVGYNYPIVSEPSYYNACTEFGLDWTRLVIHREEIPTIAPALPHDLQFVADFYKMMKAPTLLRGNSTFSWLAGLLGDGLVLSPVIDGLEGGKEHDCRFVAGNHPRFANLDFTENLFVAP